MVRHSLVPLLGALLVACQSDQGLGKYDDASGVEGPEIEVDPPELQFGALAQGEVATQTFWVYNVGPEDSVLDVSGIEIGGADGGFSILSSTTFSLFGQAPGQDVEVAFTPLGADVQSAEAVVASNDEDRPHVGVDLYGEGMVPELQITPDPLDMGTTYVGCDKSNEVTLTNVGSDLLIISSIAWSGDAMVFTNLNSTPLELEPEESATVQLLFVPEEDVTYTSEIVVESNEPIGTRTATQTGTGKYAGEYTDEFDIPEDPPTDILFVIDNSCSMEEEQRALTRNFTIFASSLSTLDADYQIAVITTDDPDFRGEILTASTPGLEDEFISQANVGTRGDSNERPTEMAYQSTRRGGDAGPGSDFLRDDAMLSMIFVSDEPDSSPDGWATYLAYFQGLKTDSDYYVANAISGDWPLGCDDASATNTVYDLTVATGGLYLSICASDWGTYMEDLAAASISQETFTLSHTAAETTIQVYVNGTERTGGWDYDPSTNSVTFDPAFVPVGGDQVQIDYAAIATCD